MHLEDTHVQNAECRMPNAECKMQIRETHAVVCMHVCIHLYVCVYEVLQFTRVAECSSNRALHNAAQTECCRMQLRETRPALQTMQVELQNAECRSEMPNCFVPLLLLLLLMLLLSLSNATWHPNAKASKPQSLGLRSVKFISTWDVPP